ncbi:MAG: hypothetical protein FWD65_07400, partial [Coriobacteriia bacterium]|nr:hypothetical protein [Coriobacteriia bacterium]
MTNNDNDLIARYIYAVTRYLPEKTRADVDQELDGLISDMLSERCGDVTPTDKDIRIVLIELGSPEELAAKYSGEEGGALISGGYFILYKRILRFLLPVVALAVAASGAFSTIFNRKLGGNPLIFAGTLFGQTIGGALAGAFQAFAILTIIFALFEHWQVRIDQGDFISRLRPVPKDRERIKPFRFVFGMFWSV